jgi:hypothetical protein
MIAFAKWDEIIKPADITWDDLAAVHYGLANSR